MIYWITGRAGSGKTSKAKEIAQQVERPVILDGDNVRNEFKNFDYSDRGRWRQINRMVSISKILMAQSFTPIVACISPYKAMRKYVESEFLNEIEIIQLQGGTMWEGTEYED